MKNGCTENSLLGNSLFRVVRFSKNVEQEERIQVYRLLPFWRTKCVEMNYELVNERDRNFIRPGLVYW